MVMELGQTRRQLLEAAARIAREQPRFDTYTGKQKSAKERLWDAFRESLFLDDFHPAPDLYRDRVVALLERAEERKADVALFPACAFLTNSGDDNESAEEKIARYYSQSKIPTIVAGTLWVPDRRGQTSDEGYEGALHVVGGSIATAFRGAIRADVNGHPGVLAISSNVGDVHNVLGLAPLEADRRRKRIVLDMGHHQYGYHYCLQTLRLVQEELSQGVDAFVALAFWRRFGGTADDDWVQPRSEDAGSTWRRERGPDSVQWTDSAKRVRTDRIDYFDV